MPKYNDSSTQCTVSVLHVNHKKQPTCNTIPTKKHRYIAMSRDDGMVDMLRLERNASRCAGSSPVPGS